jgi:hypothetical protein
MEVFSALQRLFEWQPHDSGLRPKMRKLSWTGWKYREMTADEQRAFLKQTIENFRETSAPKPAGPLQNLILIMAITAGMSRPLARAALFRIHGKIRKPRQRPRPRHSVL